MEAGLTEYRLDQILSVVLPIVALSAPAWCFLVRRPESRQKVAAVAAAFCLLATFFGPFFVAVDWTWGAQLSVAIPCGVASIISLIVLHIVSKRAAQSRRAAAV